MTCKQTTSGLIGLAIYLIEEKGFKYVLLGFITSDPIERRFGWYRQLCGANYFLSVRQLLESEKKIRLHVLVHGDLKNISFQEACEILKTSQDPKNVLAEAIQLLSHLSFEFGSEFNVDSEGGILYFIAGFLARAEVKRVKCESCASLFCKSKDTPEIELDNDLGDSKEKFLEQINRGGLFTPSDLLYVCVLHARQLYKEIHDKGGVEKIFLQMSNQRDVFSACFELKLKSDDNASDILDQTCKDGHKFSERIKSIGARIFNIFSKNFIAELNDNIHADRKRKEKADEKKSPSARKVKKLQSD